MTHDDYHEAFKHSDSYRRLQREITKHPEWGKVYSRQLEQIKEANWRIRKLQVQGAKASPAYKSVQARIKAMTGHEINRYIPLPKKGDPMTTKYAKLAQKFTSMKTSTVEGVNEWIDNMRAGLETRIKWEGDPRTGEDSWAKTLSAQEVIDLFTILNNLKINYRDLPSDEVLECYSDMIREFGRRNARQGLDKFAKLVTEGLKHEKDQKAKQEYLNQFTSTESNNVVMDMIREFTEQAFNEDMERYQ